MKGIIFTTFNEMVEQKYGLETWDQLLEIVKPPSEGIYTVGQIYPDSEIMSLITSLATLKQLDPRQLIDDFGVYMFPVLAKKYPIFLSQDLGFKDFLKSINDIIHVEVKKLYPDAILPSIYCEEIADNKIIMNYSSKRKLCYLAMGLIRGAASYFNHTVTIRQLQCMHEGASECRLEVTIG